MKDRKPLLVRLYRLKLLLIGAVLVIAGLALNLVSLSLPPSANHSLVSLLDWLADLLMITGALGIVVDVLTARQKAKADQAILGVTFDEKIPEMASAVLTALGESKNHLKDIASPQLLDDIATNALSLRLGDDQFAREIYTDVRDQGIRAPERWYDVDVSIRLSSIEERETLGLPRFDVLVKWEYTAVPSHRTQKFACVSDRDEFRDMIADVPSTLPWLMTARPGFVASDKKAFELLEYRVDGKLKPIRRSARKTGQTYVATLGDEVVQVGKPVRISYLYRTITPKSGHRLFFEITQPTRGLSIKMDYTDTDIAHMSVTDLVTSATPARITELPEQADAKVLTADLSSWLLPRAGFAYVWTLNSELPSGSEAAASSCAAPESANA